MFNNVAIEVALGLIFIFLLYSLLASIFQEFIARFFGLRARTLVKALRRMLEDEKKETDFTLVNFFVDLARGVEHYFAPLEKDTFLQSFYSHPSIKYLGENHSNSKPSYISAANFSQVMIQLLRGEGYNQSRNEMQMIRDNLIVGDIDGFKIERETLRFLQKMWTDSKNDLQRFQLKLEAWFNDTMDRATGWYKKQSQLILFATGLLLACNFNVDAIAITKILANNKDIREQMASLAMDRHKKYESFIQSQQDSVFFDTSLKKQVTLRFVNIGDDELDSMAKDMRTDAMTVQQILGLGDYKNLPPDIKKKYQPDDNARVAGWIITALAICLGAPFWFDLLNKLMLLRNAGTRPPEQDNTTSKPSAPPIQPVG